ncbi:glycerol-3-phosphate dehydrogenase [Oscillatoria sp. CS-180]|uniref:glycerol-3-phosphate dehydrogenase n=1 Tax=Oscillatoria sp. CS-180 TaxID=3021720 RepID=UPI00232DABD5|nr:glycerol-3-phosphate dehydrogenase [Oscillatoria sp. CS-180]MDB9524688.1 glycerol-3-phosphate dehydrogenase [Oscillatoria sp. CS-180]
MRDLQAIQSRSYDLFVIGGGVNGAATARDAALRGLSVLLVEKNDFASGTTSWSTRLVHGGLRYLEYFEFNLVRESLREREILLKSAPHLVKPIQMTIPIYGSGTRSYWEIQAGMVLYDILSYDKTLPNHRMLSQAKLRQLFRSVDHDNAKGAAQYYDGQAEHAERLCLETLLDAKAAGADILNYATVTGLKREGDRLTSFSIYDQIADQDFTASLKETGVVVNTSGPWVDRVLGLGERNGKAEPIGSDRKIGGTKGSHIIVDPFPGAPSSALYVEAKSDGRPFFIVPWCGQFLIGTTDLKYTGDLDKVKADNDEIDYLVSETNRVVPTARLTREDVKFTYSGVRPLPYSEGKKAGSITRAHILYDHEKEGVRNLVSLIGGKLTTHRQVGEEMTDWAFKKMGKAVKPSPTRHRPLPGCIWPDDDRLTTAYERYRDQVSTDSLNYLFETYGVRAIDLLALVDNAPDLAEPLTETHPNIRAEVVFAVQQEMAHTLLDITRRRTILAMNANYGYDVLAPILETLQKHCGWTTDQCQAQERAYRQFMEENCIPDYAIESGIEGRSLQAV